MMFNLVCALAVGIFARRAVLMFPEFEWVLWIFAVLGAFIFGALYFAPMGEP